MRVLFAGQAFFFFFSVGTFLRSPYTVYTGENNAAINGRLNAPRQVVSQVVSGHISTHVSPFFCPRRQQTPEPYHIQRITTPPPGGNILGVGFLSPGVVYTVGVWYKPYPR